MHSCLDIYEFCNTLKKTIKAIHDVSSKCKAIGTTDLTAAENYVIKVVEEKMSKLGQKQRTQSIPQKRKEITPDWLKEQQEELSQSIGQTVSRGPQQTYENEQQRIEDERRRLKDMLAQHNIRKNKKKNQRDRRLFKYGYQT
jgi:exonuclease VII large subunit